MPKLVSSFVTEFSRQGHEFKVPLSGLHVVSETVNERWSAGSIFAEPCLDGMRVIVMIRDAYARELRSEAVCTTPLGGHHPNTLLELALEGTDSRFPEAFWKALARESRDVVRMDPELTPQAHNPPAPALRPVSGAGESTSPRSGRMVVAEREPAAGLAGGVMCENSGREANGDSGSS